MTSVQTAAVSPADVLERLGADGGFTYDPTAGVLVDVGDRDGWAIARAGSERIIGPDLADTDAFLRAFAAALAEARLGGALVGGWYSPERGVWMVEVSDVHAVDRVTAQVLGMVADQETVFNMRTGETIAVPQDDGVHAWQ